MKYTIGQTAKILGVTAQTLRRWEASGLLMSHRSKGGHRYYEEDEIREYCNSLDIFKLAFNWTLSDTGENILKHFYCSDSSVFKARLGKMLTELQKDLSVRNLASLITASAGEIGNNSFDHNLGNWPDKAGIFFGYHTKKRQIVLADRGQGVLTTLSRVRPELKIEKDALKVAFTEFVTGRAPQHRGNGLKWVKKNVCDYDLDLVFQSGNARLKIGGGNEELKIKEVKNKIQGCLSFINY